MFHLLILYLLIEEVLYYENFDLETVVSPIDYEVFEKLLVESRYDSVETQFLIDGIKNGFDIGYRGQIEGIRRTAPNLKLRVGSQLILWNKIMKEVSQG